MRITENRKKMILRDYTNLRNKQIWGVQRGVYPLVGYPPSVVCYYPFIIRSYAIYIGQEKPPPGRDFIFL